MGLAEQWSAEIAAIAISGGAQSDVYDALAALFVAAATISVSRTGRFRGWIHIMSEPINPQRQNTLPPRAVHRTIKAKHIFIFICYRFGL